MRLPCASQCNVNVTRNCAMAGGGESGCKHGDRAQGCERWHHEGLPGRALRQQGAARATSNICARAHAQILSFPTSRDMSMHAILPIRLLMSPLCFANIGTALVDCSARMHSCRAYAIPSQPAGALPCNVCYVGGGHPAAGAEGDAARRGRKGQGRGREEGRLLEGVNPMHMHNAVNKFAASAFDDCCVFQASALCVAFVVGYAMKISLSAIPRVNAWFYIMISPSCG